MLQPVELYVPSAWRTLLAQFPANTVLAGGALRDLHNGREVKDLDLWVPADPNPWEKIWSVTAHWGDEPREETGGSSGDPVNGIERVQLWAVPGWDLPVNIMVCRPIGVEAVIQTFDFGICQIGCAADGKVFATGEYFRDRRDHTFTFIDAPGRTRERSWRRWERIGAKYSGWRVVNLEKPSPAFDWGTAAEVF